MVTFACWHLAVVAFLDGHSKNSLKLLLSPMQIFCEPGNLKMGKTIKKQVDFLSCPFNYPKDGERHKG